MIGIAAARTKFEGSGGLCCLSLYRYRNAQFLVELVGWWTSWNGGQIWEEIWPQASLHFLLIHDCPLADALFLLVSKSDEVTTT